MAPHPTATMQQIDSSRLEKVSHLRSLHRYLKRHIHGQDHVLGPVSHAIIRAELGLEKPGRFLFLGPTGVGKTETAMAFTRYLRGDSVGSIVRYDCSEFRSPDSLRWLLGDRVGDRGRFGTLGQKGAVTLLFDEIEKAGRDFLDLLLQVLEPGRITLASGEPVDLSNCFVVCTSNIASHELLELKHSTPTTLERHVLSRAQQVLRPEIFNRFDETLVFRPLEYDTQVEILRQKLEEYLEPIRAGDCDIALDATVLPFLIRHGFDRRLGARPVLRAIRKHVGNALAEDLLAGGNGKGRLCVDATTDQLTMTTARESTPPLVRPIEIQWK